MPWPTPPLRVGRRRFGKNRSRTFFAAGRSGLSPALSSHLAWHAHNLQRCAKTRNYRAHSLNPVSLGSHCHQDRPTLWHKHIQFGGYSTSASIRRRAGDQRKCGSCRLLSLFNCMLGKASGDCDQADSEGFRLPIWPMNLHLIADTYRRGGGAAYRRGWFINRQLRRDRQNGQGCSRFAHRQGNRR